MLERFITPTLIAICASAAAMAMSAAPAFAESPWFHLSSGARPTYLPPEGKGQIVATAVNVGDAGTCVKVAPDTGRYMSSKCTEAGAADTGEFEASPVTLTDTLPEGLTITSVEAIMGSGGENPLKCSHQTVEEREVATCKLEHVLPPFSQIEVRVGVTVEGARTGAQNVVSVTGGGAPPLQISRPVTVSASPAPFGVEDYELTPEEEGGAADTQAGSHPFQLTTTFTLNQTAAVRPSESTTGKYETEPVAQAKDLNFRLPPGLIGNPHPFARCTLAQFDALNVQCPADTVLGVAVVSYDEPGILGLVTQTQPLYNLEPQAGEPARFAFRPTKETPVFLDTSVRTGEGYGVTVTVRNITQIVGFVSNTVTLWGVPGAASHDGQRGNDCLGDYEATGPCKALEAVSPPPFLDLPGSCTNRPLETEVLADSWDEPSRQVTPAPDPSGPMPALDGCNALPLHASISATPDVQEASKPSGLTVDVHVPQSEALNAEGLAPTELKDITVTLPEGVDLNPSAADGLVACPLLKGNEPGKEAQEARGEITGIDLESRQPANCPNASKIANVEIDTPLLPNPLTGFVYLASPQNFREGPLENPFSSLVAMYLVAEDPVSGTLIKLPGSVSLNQSTGQITSTFAGNPQLPFEDAKLEFFGGERAPLATPDRCGSYTTNASFVPWSAEPWDVAALTVPSSSTFDIATGPGGSPCESPLPFGPTLSSGTANINAGSFSELTTTLSRPSGDQSIQSVTLHYPAGVSGLLSGVKLCPEAQANEGTCGPESQIGETIVSVGVGGEPFTVTGGRVYITGPYHGAPFGLSIVNPAKAGPFDLQEGRPVVVRAKIEVNPTTAALTVTTNSAAEGHAIPSIIEGFALQIQHVNVLIDRPGFTFNPTNCTPQKVTGTMNSSEGASSPVSDPFQVTNCAALKFAPKFAVSTSAKTSRAGGASLHVELSYPNKAEGAFDGPEGAYTNIARVKVELPKALPSRLTTLQKACTSAQFETNPAGCPPASIVGHAKAITPLLPVPLEGPAYFVSHGGEAFPSLIIVLQGYGVTVDLVGSTFIDKAGITSSTFKTVPDAPVGSFELTLPQGQFSALAANGNLCKDKLAMPTEFVAQNGAEIHESTKIAVTGCPKHKTKHAKKNSEHRRKPGSRPKKKH